MNCATVSSKSCFCSLFRDFPSLAAKNQSYSTVHHMVLSMCRNISWVVAKGYLLSPVVSLDKILLAFALLPFVLQAYTCLLFQVSLDFWHLPSNSLWRSGHLLGLISFHRTSQLQLLQHQCLEHKLGLLWYWMVCFGNEPISFCIFWDSNKLLYFRLFCWLCGLLHFFKGILPHSSRYNGYLN